MNLKSRTRSTRFWPALVSIVALSATLPYFGCSSSASSQSKYKEGETGGAQGSGGGSGSGGTDTTGGTTGSGGTDASGGSAGDGAAGAGPIDDQCASRKVDDALGIFVEQSLGVDSPTCGDREAPCKTVQTGIDRASALGNRSIVYVAAGTYVETPKAEGAPALALKPGIVVDGAWGVVNKNWTPICTAQSTQAVVIQAANNANITVGALAIDGQAGLSHLTVRSKAAAAPGESLYGVFARNSNTTLTLDYVSVEVAKGGDGEIGAKGSNGTTPSTTCTGASTGANATTIGAKGGGAQAGFFGASGYVLGTAGTKGGSGAYGANGTLIDQTCASCGTCSACSFSATSQSCGTAGAPGCGGTPPAGGDPGKSAGSSVAVYVWESTVVVNHSVLKSGDGGAGGRGGPSGDVAAGSSGSTGSNGNSCTVDCASYEDTCCIQVCNDPLPQLSKPMLVEPLAPICHTECEPCTKCKAVLGSGKAGVGGKGGSSSAGGLGGDGAGGSSYAIWKNAGAKVTQTDSTLLPGKAGVSPGNGAAGTAAPISP